jgi:hypothetical protein
VEHNLSDLLGHGGLRANSIVWSLVGTSTTGGANDLALAGLAIVIAVLAYHVCMLLRRRVTSEQLPSEILRRSFLVLLALLTLGLSWFWPWYVLWLLPFASLVSRKSMTVLMVAFTVSAFAIHWSSYYQTVVGDHAFQLPLMVVLFGPVALTAGYLAVKRMPALRPRPAS